MSYTKTDWKDGTTPLDATNMNKIEDGIAANADDISSLNDDLANIDIFGGRGTAINSGDDLDDYTTPGSYYSQSASVSSTLSNSPAPSTGFRMFVLQTAYTNSYMQIALVNHTNNTVFQLRTKTQTSDWTSWRQVAYA